MDPQRRIWLASALFLAISGSIVASGNEEVLVTCGSTIKLQHEGTGHHLHSQEVSYGYGRSSGQQSVTGFPEMDSVASLWTVRSADGGCAQGSPLKAGTEVKLQHVGTRRWLHSHLFHSPLSNNQEVSAFGDDSHSDSGDVWVLELEGGGAAWAREGGVRLKHKDTGAYLASHNVKYQRPIPGHTEVFGTKQRSKAALWRATQGIYMPKGAEL